MKKDNESKEMYLETILVLFKENGYVRSIDISEKLKYSRASVSRAMKDLKDDGLITVDKGHFIKLTDAGQTIADNILKKHKLLTKLFIKIGVDKEIAEKDACRIEHIISEETFNAVKTNLCNDDSRD